MDDVRRTVTRALSTDTRERFDERVAEQAARLREDIAAGHFDSGGFAVGLELELYAVDSDGRLTRLPDSLFSSLDCSREIGLHNVEINGSPQRFDPAGVEAQSAELRTSVEALRAELRTQETTVSGAETAARRLVFDGMWTVPPAEGSSAYLGAVDRQDGLVIAENMVEKPRYRSMDNVLVEHADGEIPLSVPGADHRFPTILLESLTSSIQPHLQIPDAASFPAYFNAAIRTMGPVLALSTNSPFLPSDLYNAVEEPYQLVTATPHELRIPVFEGTVNSSGHTKARCPADIETPSDIVDRIVDDWTCGPFLREWEAENSETVPTEIEPYWEFSHKYGTYWRWVRSIIGSDASTASDESAGESASKNDAAGGSLRIEYRPLPTQPTVEDVLSLHWLTVGLLRGIVATGHPLTDVAWADAREGFYNAVENGLDAAFYWITADGEPTSKPEEIYPELFDLAREGLYVQGHTQSEADRLLKPMADRWERRETPSQWKKARVRDALDEGLSLADAIETMQADYNRRSWQGEPFATW